MCKIPGTAGVLTGEASPVATFESLTSPRIDPGPFEVLLITGEAADGGRSAAFAVFDRYGRKIGDSGSLHEITSPIWKKFGMKRRGQQNL